MAEPAIKVRKMEIDFSDAKVHWSAGQPEHSQLWNGMSIAVPYLEPFLLKAMRQLKDKVPADMEELRKDIDMFVAQEARHFKLHIKSNKRLHEEGYDIGDLEAKAKADYERFFKKGLKFSLAYCEGFETFGPILAGYFFEGVPDLMEDWDEASCFLWMWHIAEEWEHRTVANYTYKTIYDDYWYRIYGLWYAMLHLFSFMYRAGYRMIRQDRRTGVIADRWKSHVRLAKVTGRLLGYMMPRVLFHAQRRDYDPGKIPPPPNVMKMLDQTSEKYGILQPA
ncbi:MAG: metal-dependent hydrolase [Chloroflexota bacterium]